MLAFRDLCQKSGVFSSQPVKPHLQVCIKWPKENKGKKIKEVVSISRKQGFLTGVKLYNSNMHCNYNLTDPSSPQRLPNIGNITGFPILIQGNTPVPR